MQTFAEKKKIQGRFSKKPKGSSSTQTHLEKKNRAPTGALLQRKKNK